MAEPSTTTSSQDSNTTTSSQDANTTTPMSRQDKKITTWYPFSPELIEGEFSLLTKQVALPTALHISSCHCRVVCNGPCNHPVFRVPKEPTDLYVSSRSIPYTGVAIPPSRLPIQSRRSRQRPIMNLDEHSWPLGYDLIHLWSYLSAKSTLIFEPLLEHLTRLSIIRIAIDPDAFSIIIKSVGESQVLQELAISCSNNNEITDLVDALHHNRSVRSLTVQTPTINTYCLSALTSLLKPDRVDKYNMSVPISSLTFYHTVFDQLCDMNLLLNIFSITNCVEQLSFYGSTLPPTFDYSLLLKLLIKNEVLQALDFQGVTCTGPNLGTACDIINDLLNNNGTLTQLVLPILPLNYSQPIPRVNKWVPLHEDIKGTTHDLVRLRNSIYDEEIERYEDDRGNKLCQSQSTYIRNIKRIRGLPVVIEHVSTFFESEYVSQVMSITCMDSDMKRQQNNEYAPYLVKQLCSRNVYNMLKKTTSLYDMLKALVI